ncbi:hypothetical protein DSM109990_03509 (plasmid) [Sulfitobacter dubius]|uniref:Uncharacterized protein n=1 Tax=Sulfitobacter dubius TaxID=218673 RepID=A0ABY3ZPN9_9RHOB|nr:hypothetical protein DSM109990_03509 [Sulfitobacter dubius]
MRLHIIVLIITLQCSSPILSAERDQGDQEAVDLAIGTKHDRDTIPLPAVPDEPAVQRC